AYAASNSGDKVGVLFVTDKVQKTIELRKGRNHVLRIIRDLISFPTAPGGTGLKKALEETRRLLKHSGIVFILSDFKAEGYESSLRQLSRKHDVVAIRIEDPAEAALPALGRVSLLDPESGVEIEAGLDLLSFKNALSESKSRFETRTQQIFNLAGVESLPVKTAEDHVEAVLLFLKRRKSRR
ncbi:VWA domain-containing protein, partial [bacterium]|nr:VWA domain-containing protein [bacterium]